MGSWLPFALLIALYIGFGLLGHEPWKADEAYIFGIIHSMLEDDSWLVPLVAGEPFMEKPPLYAWVGAGLVRLLDGYVRAPDAARLASAVFMGVSAWSLAKASRCWWGRNAGRYAPILLCSCIGVLAQSHMMLPDLPLLTGMSLGLWGFAFILTSPISGGVLLGLGGGIGFLAKGLLGPGILGLCAILLPVIFRSWRQRKYGVGLLVATGTSLPLIAIWPILLYHRSPILFASWFWDNNFGRFFGTSIEIRGTEKPVWFWLQTLPWFAFPALPMAIHTLVIKRHAFLSHPGMQCMTMCASIILVTLSASAAARAVYALPLLAPLAVLGVPAIFATTQVLEKAWIAVSAAVFGAFSVFVWMIWLDMTHTGVAPSWPWLNQWLPADFVASFEASRLATAALVSVAGVLAVRRCTIEPGRGLMTWMTCITFAWTLLTTLAMPWLDHAKSYRAVFESIPWPKTHGCIESRGLGESERAMLDYYANRLTHRREVSVVNDCDLLFVQGFVQDQLPVADSKGWEMIWSGARPGDNRQKFWLYRTKLPTTGVGRTDEKRQQSRQANLHHTEHDS